MPLFGGSVFADKNLSDLEQNIDKILQTIPSINSKTESEEETGKFLNLFTENTKDDEINKILEEATIPRDRLMRYATYEELYRAVPMIKRIFKVYKPNILQKNPVTGKCYMIKDVEDSKVVKDTEEDKEKIEKAKQFIDDVIKNFNLIEKLKNIVLHSQLLYGDVFIETVDVEAESKKFEASKTLAALNVLNEQDTPPLKYNGEIREMLEPALRGSIITEARVKDLETRTNNLNFARSNIYEIDSLLQECANCLIVEEDSGPSKDEQTDNPFDNVLLKIHKPHNILVLETEYGSRIGYLEIQKQQEFNTTNMTQNLSLIIGRITNMANPQGLTQEKVVNRLIYYVLKKAISSKKSKMQNPEAALKSLGEDTYRFIKRMLIEQGMNRKAQYQQLKVRFIPSNRMVPFSMASAEFAPYGESVVDPLVFPSKLYTLAQLANTITKLSRASVIRKWSIDVGSTQMHTKYIQQLKRELYNTRVTLEDLASFKAIPKILSDFKDMFAIVKDGKRPVDVEIQPMGDASIKVADLEDARREIISLSGIPAPYLGYMDTVELREQLVHANVSFSTEITDIQETVTKGFNEVIDTVAEMLEIGFKPSDYAKFTLIPPVVLILQLIEMTMSSVGNIAGVFTGMQMQVDPYFFLKSYVPHVDWDKFIQKSKEYSTELAVKNEIMMKAQQKAQADALAATGQLGGDMGG
jgi:hypothetical protein